ncbi:RNA helicase [Arachnomyces sp. PD_36]|nr:RNA helicase [Arachnomyces sp. PD_36]
MASAQMRRRKPARMTLSQDVAKSYPINDKGRKPPVRRSNSPFGAMNQTQANIRGAARPRTQAELKRTTGGKKEQAQPEKKERPLFKALKMQTTLAPISYGHRSAVKAKLGDITSFDQFPLLPIVQSSIQSQALPGLVDITPTPAQRLTIPTLLESDAKKANAKPQATDTPQFDQYLLAAETGSGKTLAYLLPVVDAVKRAEVVDKEEEERLKLEKEEERKQKKNVFELDTPVPEDQPHPTCGRPRAIILVPTSELVTQVGGLVKTLSHTIKYRSGLVSSAYSGKKIRSNLFSPGGIDILVSTPHLLSTIAEKEPNILSRVSHIVVDEADSLLDRSFSPMTTAIIDKAASSLKQLVLCSATIPRSLDSFLRKRFPDIRRLVTPNLHTIPRRVQLGVVDVDKEPYRGSKSLACADVLWSLGKAGGSSDEIGRFSTKPEMKNIIVFVNERDSSEEVAQYLVTKGIDAVALSRDTTEQRQTEVLADFTTQKAPPAPKEIMLAEKKHKYEKESAIPFAEPPKPTAGSHRRLPNTKVLVTTDLFSRGIDTSSVKHVILYDVPHSTIDFIHRLGRTGRMGRRGRGIVLVGKKDRKDVVKEVRDGMFRGQALI